MTQIALIKEYIEYGEDVDLGELDLQGITVACAWQDTNSIPETQIQLLKSVVLKSKSREKPATSIKGKYMLLPPLALKIVTQKMVLKL
jgi:hypothetical protein